MRAVFADTSALYATLDVDAALHERAVESWDGLVGRAVPLLVSNYVILETAALVHTRLGKGAARDFLENLIPLMSIEWVDPGTHNEATTAYLLSLDKEMSLVDCTSFILMRKLSLRRAFTYDRHFAAQGFETVGK